MREGYARAQMDFASRNPSKLKELRELLDTHAGDLSLGPLVREIQKNLTADGIKFTLVRARIIGNLPLDSVANRDVSGWMILNDQTMEFARTAGSEVTVFNLTATPTGATSFELPVQVSFAVEQHLRLWNRFFGGAATLNVFDALGEREGLSHTLTFRVPIQRDEDAEDVSEVDIRPSSGETVRVELEILAKPLPALVNIPEGCKG